jgi:histone acetyltransferase (RNA polymerase elongator complex component)
MTNKTKMTKVTTTQMTRPPEIKDKIHSKVKAYAGRRNIGVPTAYERIIKRGIKGKGKRRKGGKRGKSIF